MLLDIPSGALRKAVQLKELPYVPPSNWSPPTYFPDLRNAAWIGYDVETKDTDLLTAGPGWGRNAGHIVGISIAAIARNGERWSGYYPIAHEFPREMHLNCNPANVFAWAKDMLETSHIPKVTANGIYDTGWFGHHGINVQGPIYDVQFAEALIDENAKVALDALGQKYLGHGKTTSKLYQYLAKAYGGKPSPNQRANLYRSPPSLAGPYAMEDSVMLFDILTQQWTDLENQHLTSLFQMECDTIPLYVEMRRVGVRINLQYAEEMYLELNTDIARIEAQFNYKYGVSVQSFNSAAQIAKVFDKLGIPYPRTDKGSGSFQKDWLKNLEHPVGDEINEIRELHKLHGTFVRSYLLEKNVNGRIHCSFHPLKGDDNGTKTGRLSSSHPNLQNIPARTEIGKKVRKAFIPDIGHLCWEKNDYSQIEYRMLAHFACDSGDQSAATLRHNYRTNPDADYHNVVYDNVCPYMGWDPTDDELRANKRRHIKNTNFGLLYGQGQRKLALTMGFDADTAKTFFDGYHSGAPYVKPTMQMCADEVHQYGYVRTILGRRTRFNLWEPIERNRGELRMALPFDDAIREYGSSIKRAYDYRAVNYKFQGSAADVMKKAMHDCWKAGVFSVTGVPRLTVHDELDFSVIDDSPMRREAHREMINILENTIPFDIPIRVDGHGVRLSDGREKNRGPNWGDSEQKERKNAKAA